MINPAIVSKLAHPFYGDHVLYHAYDFRPGATTFRAWEFNGWQKESLSWRTGCYIHAGLSRTGPISIRGREAKKYLQSILINSLEKFPVGSMKHGVMCTDDGLIAAHGIIERKGEDHFESIAGGPPAEVRITKVPFDVEIKRLDYYLFQIAGPTSLQVLEKVTGESLRDVGFLRFRDTRINGIRCEVGRIGMTGDLAYELHGPIEDGPAIYEAVYQAGQDSASSGLAGAPISATISRAAFRRAPGLSFRHRRGAPAGADEAWQVSGSVDPANMRARIRTPVEVRWHNMARFDHDFIGREALAAEIANPKRTTVTLRWNADDVLDTYASLFRPGSRTSRSTCPMRRSGGRWRTPIMSSRTAVRSATRRARSTALSSANFFRSAASTSAGPDRQRGHGAVG